MKRKSDTIRFSRAGDQFHYRWAARRCLALLDPMSELVCITIEGISSNETEVEKNESGEEVVDVAEYFGDSSIRCATKISYHQLKHSYKEDKPWTLSALSNTLEGFFKRYLAFKKEAKDLDKQCVEFTYTTNRPGAADTLELIARIKNKSLEDKDAKNWKQIKGYHVIISDLHFQILHVQSVKRIFMELPNPNIISRFLMKSSQGAQGSPNNRFINGLLRQVPRTH